MIRETLPQQRSRETREKILSAARRVFGRRGYAEATIEDIAAEAGVSNGALYHHFANKQELFDAILESHISDQHFEISALIPAASLREVLERFASYWFEHLRTDHGEDPLFAEIWAHAARDPSTRQSITDFIKQSTSMIESAVSAGQASGFVRRDIDATAAATIIYATMEGLFLLWIVAPQEVDAEQLSEPWVDSMERLLATDAEPDAEKFRGSLEDILTAEPQSSHKRPV